MPSLASSEYGVQAWRAGVTGEGVSAEAIAVKREGGLQESGKRSEEGPVW
jgi:hypothetical protein